MIPLNYHHLYYFWTVARAGSVSMAAEELFLAQSTLSLQIQRLERTLGSRLLIRSKRGVGLTQEGRLAFEYCEQIFSRGQALLSSFKKERPVASLLRIGVEESVSRHVVLELLAFIRRKDPHIRIWISGGTPRGIQDRLQRFMLDLTVSGVDFSYQLGPGFRSRHVASIPLALVGTRDIKKRIRAFPKDMGGIPMLLRTPENPVRKGVDQFFHKHKIVPTIAAEVEDVELLKILALEGQGAAVLDVLTIREDLARGRLVKLRKTPMEGRESVWIIADDRGDEASPLYPVVHALMSNFSVSVKYS